MPLQLSQIFCANWFALALAGLDGINLCAPCLMKEVARQAGKDTPKITPLKHCLRGVRGIALREGI